MTPDVNVLLAAARSDHGHHRIAAAALWEPVAARGAGPGLTLLPIAVTGFLRLVTNQRVFAEPTPLTEALGFIDDLLCNPGVRITEVGAEWSVLSALCLEHGLTGNAIPDAWIAAAVRYHHETLVTFDRDFRRLLRPRELVLLPRDGRS